MLETREFSHFIHTRRLPPTAAANLDYTPDNYRNVTKVNYTSRHLIFSTISNSALDDAICLAKSKNIVIPFGVGIAGVVAESKEVINIKNAYDDPRFNDEIDQKTGYKTNTILSMPICNYEGKYIRSTFYWFFKCVQRTDILKL